MLCSLFFFFFKQKTAYEIYQCDWSSDVCSSDLDLTIVLDLDVRTGLRRNSLANKRDRFEMEVIEFHERVRKGYLRIAEEEPERVKVVDASRPVDAVFEEIKLLLDQTLPNKSG